VDRCALFVDAGYVLADGAMAVHGTDRRESVSWDYEGLLQLLASLATERSGLPLLRCYWYEATVEGRRTAEHDALADLPGVKLRLAKMRPGRREGVESEIHRDLTTLARNKAVSDAMVVSAEEDLAQVIAEVQDLGLRVSLLHIAVEGNGAIPRSLRQECDDIAEISSEHLRPYVELISGAEPHTDERESAPLIALRPTANGNAGLRDLPATPPDLALAAADTLAAPLDAPVLQPDALPVRQDEIPARQDQPAGRPDLAAAAWDPQPPARQDFGLRQEIPARGAQELYAAPVAMSAPAADQAADHLAEYSAARARPAADLSGYNPGAAREQLPRDPMIREPFPREQLPTDSDTVQLVPAATGSAQIRRLPTRGASPSTQAPGQPMSGQPTAAQPVLSATTSGQPAVGQPSPAQAMPTAPGAGYAPGRNGAYSGQQPTIPAGGNAGAQPGISPVQGPVMAGQAAYSAQPDPLTRSGPLNLYGQGTVASAQTAPGAPAGSVGTPAYSGAQPAVSLADAVQSAHEEGQEFGATVARDAPALWLEAVLARKPRMPSDLEARLLQGSALPIDYLLHDEVRHALRRGFWDAMERARR
jgi:uncharacterized LabA/DUF88 family protein